MQETKRQAQCLYVGRVEVSGGTLNVRSAPGGAVIDQLARGEEVNVLSDEGEWLEIEHAGGVGYAAKRYICFAQAKQDMRLVIEDEAGNAFTPTGGFTLKMTAGPID